MRYRILDQINKSKNRQHYLESLSVFIDEGAYSTDTIIREKELSEIVERELNQLPPKMRMVFELSRIDHLSQSEICERLNISGNTVKKQMNNAIKILRRRINLNRLMLVLLYCYLLTKK